MTLAEAARRLKHPQTGCPRLLLVTDPHRLPDPVAVAERLPPGAAIVLRHYDDPRRAALAARLAAVARRRRLVLMVAGDWRLAARVGAAGLHLPEFQARTAVLAPLLGWCRRRGRRVAVACHGPAALARAARLKADWAVLSPVFPTASHPGATGIGAVRFALWASRARLPVVALGGVTAERAKRLRHACGLAAIGGLK